MILKTRDLQLGYHPRQAVTAPITLALPHGAISCVIGPNGSGKSTLLRGLAGVLRPLSGSVNLGELELVQWPKKQLARQIAFLPQTPMAPNDISAYQLVRHGRYPHQPLLGRFSAEDQAAVDWAMQATDVQHFQDRKLNQLSGGEKQRCWLAMVLAQRTQYLLLDEPTTFLDIGHQFDILVLLRKLNAQLGLTIIMVLHDINQASQFADHIVVMQQGNLIASGSPHEVITQQLLYHTFGLQSDVIERPNGQRKFPYVMPKVRLSES